MHEAPREQSGRSQGLPGMDHRSRRQGHVPVDGYVDAALAGQSRRVTDVLGLGVLIASRAAVARAPLAGHDDIDGDVSSRRDAEDQAPRARQPGEQESQDAEPGEDGSGGVGTHRGSQ